MSVKLIGADYKRFFADTEVWKTDCWFDDVLTVVNGEEIGMDDDLDETNDLKDDDKIEVHGGVFYLGHGIDAPHVSYEKVLRAWLKKQTTTTLVIDVDNARLSEVKAALKALQGVKVSP